MGVKCVRSVPRANGNRTSEDVLPSLASHASIEKSPFRQVSLGETPGLLSSTETNILRATPLGHLPTGEELKGLVHLYFSSVHRTYPPLYFRANLKRLTTQDFGFFAFIHQLHFNRLLAEGKAPRELTLMMIASASR